MAVGSYALAVSEITRHFGLKAPLVLGKLAWAKARHGIGPESFLRDRLFERADWPSYFSPSFELSEMIRVLNYPNGQSEYLRDKIKASAVLHENGIPLLPIAAVVGRPAGDSGPFRAIADRAELERFLSGPDCPADIVVKPVGSLMGRGIFGAVRDEAGWTVDGERLSVAQLAAAIDSGADDKGALIQPRAKSHPALAPIGGDRGLITLRVNSVLTDRGPEVVAVTQKLIVGNSLIDNYSKGRQGNLIAGVDIATGRLKAAFGLKPGAKKLILRYDRHPAFAAPITGFQLPRFDEVLEVAKRVAVAFPTTPLLGNDLAITEQGVQVVEINIDPDLGLPQTANEIGLKLLLQDPVARVASDPDRRKRALDMLRTA